MLLSATPSSAGPKSDDAALVFCTSAQHRADTVNAAVVLGLAQRGSTPDRILDDGSDRLLEEWQHSHQRQFDRACAAVIGAQRYENGSASGGSSWPAWLTTALSTLLTGAAGLFFGVLLNLSGARRAQADELRAAVGAFVNASEPLVRQLASRPPGAPPPDDEVNRCRTTLLAALDRSANHRLWRRPRRVRQLLGPGPLGARMTSGWRDGTDVDNEARLTEVHTRLGELAAEVERVALAVQMPGVPHPGMWRR